MKRIGVWVLAIFMISAFTATSAFAFHCPKLIGAGRRLVKKAGAGNGKAIQLLDEAQSLHKSGNHKASMQKATQAVALLAK
jgi:hypothetical protein